MDATKIYLGIFAFVAIGMSVDYYIDKCRGYGENPLSLKDCKRKLMGWIK